MIEITGNTFAIRSLLKEWGGRWSNDVKAWVFYHLTPAQIAIARGTMGVFVSDAPQEPDKPARGPTAVYGDDPTYFNYFRDKDPAVFFGFSSMGAFVEYVEGLDRPTVPPVDYDPSKNHDRGAGWSTHPKRVEFCATADMAEALRLARNGWSDGLGLMNSFKIPHAIGKRRMSALAGGRANVGRLLAGDPIHMVRRKPHPRNRVITLFVETTMWRGTTTYIATMRAFIVAGIIDVLETEGYVCELIAVAGTMRFDLDRMQSQLAVVIKRAGQSLNMLDITFACGHPSFLRRMKFACEGAAPECPYVGGIICHAFDDEYLPKRNEFYIPQLMPNEQRMLTGDPLDMLRFIEPDGLPIKIRERL